MRTVFSYENRIDFGRYLDAYLQRKDAIRSIPPDGELTAMAREAILRAQPAPRERAPEEPTDGMVAALQVRNMMQEPVTTVADYEALFRDRKVKELLVIVSDCVMTDILRDYPIGACDEEDISALGELEREMISRVFPDRDGAGLTGGVPREWTGDMNIRSLDEFIASRRDWYRMKIWQCLLFLNILDLKPEGETDPCDHYEVFAELRTKIFTLIRSRLEGRNQHSPCAGKAL